MDGCANAGGEFSSIYVFTLVAISARQASASPRGGEGFRSGSRAPIAISILVKNPKALENGKIYFHDIGDYLTREEKLEKITAFGSIEGITAANGWLPITPDQHGDWVGQRDDSFGEFISLGDKKGRGADYLRIIR